jgi:AcrR family transcriptional regulator
MVSLPEHLRPTPVGRERLPREVLAEHQRDRILDAAVEVFATHGYQGTTVDHLVVASHIGVGSFYEQFANKEECFLATYERVVVAGRERIVAAIPAGEPWPRQLVAALAALLAAIEEEPFAARVTLVEVQTAGARALAEHDRALDQAVALLRRGREHSDVPEELPTALEIATVGGLTWFLQQRIAAGRAGEATRWLPEVLEIVAEPYLGEDATAELAAAA